MANKLTFAVPVEWSSSRTYERNMIVFVGKKAYTAIQDVPTGIELTNDTYWIETGVPFVDIDSVKNDLEELSNTVDGIESDLTEYNTRITANSNSITNIRSDLTTAQSLIDSANTRLDNIMITLYTPSVNS